jgi:transcription-repair coupling factor (superfamily II helicase)
MILSLVSELLSRVARRPEIEETLDALRRSAGEVRLAGLTDPAKAFISAVATAQLGRPTILIVESNQRAEMLVEPARWFYRAITGKPGRRVALLPAYDVLPYESRSPHAEISEDRAVALWRFALGEADLLIVPIQAAVWRLREPEFYGELALTIARDQSIAHEALLTFLSSAGYDKQVTCEMPGQYAVRGGIIDIFSPESPQPIRVELLGDTIESIRAFDPNTQRSTNPVERAALMPLTEFPRHREVLDRLRVPSASNREDDSPPEGFYPGWEFREVLHEERKSTILDLGPDPLVIEDEPSLLADCLEKYRKQLQESFDESDDPLAEPPSAYLFSDEDWSHAIQRLPRLAIEHLGLAREGSASDRTLHTQPTTRYHGDVASFVAEVRGRITAGEHVLVSAASTGELERFADICHEFELPYRMGELEENTTVTRLAEEGSGAAGPSMVLIKAPLEDGVVFVDAN